MKCCGYFIRKFLLLFTRTGKIIYEYSIYSILFKFDGIKGIIKSLIFKEVLDIISGTGILSFGV
jgi:predicted ATPase